MKTFFAVSFYSLLAIVCFLNNSCIDLEEIKCGYKEPTTTGKDVVQCTIEGVLWRRGGLRSLYVEYFEDILVINAEKNWQCHDVDPTDGSFLEFQMEGVTGPGVYRIRERGRGSYAIVGYELNNIEHPEPPLGFIGSSTSDKDNFLSVHSIDTLARTISGSFRFRARDNFGREILVDQGMFDLKY